MLPFGKSEREWLEQRFAHLKTTRAASWDMAVKDICAQVCPYRLQMDPLAINRGERKDQKILHSKPVRSVRTLAAGMMAGITSPAREWFKITTEDPGLAKFKPVRQYLHDCQERIRSALAQSNFYKQLSSGLYVDLCGPGTAAMLHEEGAPGKLRFRAMPWGEYFLDVDPDGKVNVCFREFAMTVRQIVEKFGLARISRNVRLAYDNGDYNSVFLVYHAIMPNWEFQANTLGVKGMPFISVWWEQTRERYDDFLYKGGYHEFPVLAPRWTAMASSAYGMGPGWDSLGDCRVLQHHERRMMRLIDKVEEPPMRASANARKGSLHPGDVTMMSKGSTGGMFEPAMEVPPEALRWVAERIAAVERRVSEGFFEHLWNMLIQDDRNQRPTATEVEAKRQEVMLQLGPLLENLNSEFLEPLIERSFYMLDRADMLPMPPKEIQGVPVQIEFISIMHQMQQTTGLVGIRTLLTEVMNIAQMRPDVWDKIELDEVVEDLARITGVRPAMVLSKEEVDKVRAARAQQQQAQEKGAAMAQAAESMKTASETDVPNLAELANQFAPAVAAQGGALGPVR